MYMLKIYINEFSLPKIIKTSNIEVLKYIIQLTIRSDPSKIYNVNGHIIKDIKDYHFEDHTEETYSLYIIRKVG